MPVHHHGQQAHDHPGGEIPHEHPPWPPPPPSRRPNDVAAAVATVLGTVVGLIAGVAWLVTSTAANECKSGLVAALDAAECGQVETWHTLCDFLFLAAVVSLGWGIWAFRRR